MMRVFIPLLFLPAALQAQEPVLRVTTRLIVVDVAVEDKAGNPVSGLTSGEFVLLDKGKPQKIAIFSEHSQPLAPAPPRPPSTTFSNRTATGFDAPVSATAVLFDSLNTQPADQLKAKLRLIESLRRIPPQERVGLYALGSNLLVLHDYTGDMTALLQTLSRFEGIASGELKFSDPRTANPDLEKVVYDLSHSRMRWDREFAMWLSARAQATADAVTAIRIRQTAAALAAIAAKLSGVPGRKNLLWVSGSFPILAGFRYKHEAISDNVVLRRLPAGTRENLWPEIQRAIRALNDNNIAVYPVDAGGLRDKGGYDAERGLVEGSWNQAVPLESLTAPEAQQDAHLTMDRLAAETGGRAFYNTNDLSGAFRRALSAARSTYVLGYYPNHNQWDGSYREITVRLEQRGLKARHRTGYFATAGAPAPADALRQAVNSPLDATAIGISVELASPPLKPGAQRLTVRIERGDLQHPAGPVEAIYVQRAADGRQLAGSRDMVRFRANPVIGKAIEISPNAAQLRIVLRDTLSGRVGSITLPVTSP